MIGCGHSGGDYISLGFYEKDDIIEVWEYTKKNL